MELLTIIKNFTPSFFGSLFAAIFLAIVLGQNPLNRGWVKLLLLIIGLFIVGALATYLVLIGFKD